MTGDETDVDCGGRACGPCSVDQRCIMGTDCQSAICTNSACQAPSCTDLALNGTETDLNCGGACPVCAQGHHCASNDDCSTANCVAGICESAVCRDDVLQKACPLLVNNTPYALSPAQHLTHCIDVDQPLVSDGNPTLLHACASELRQTYWAIERPDGYFALRSALSGKCLHVRSSSMSVGGTIELSSCSYLSDQLWKPSFVDSSSMRLTSQFSGLLLDAAGDNVSSDGVAVVQGEVDGSGSTEWHVVRRTAASYVTFSPNGDRTIRIRHDGGTTSLSADDDISSQWMVVPGLSNASFVSFQSRNDPGRYLRHANFGLWSDVLDGSAGFNADATFRYADPLVGSDPLAKGLEASNFPGYFWQRDGMAVKLVHSSDTAEFKQAATWQLVAR